MAEELDATGLLPNTLDDDEDLFYGDLPEHAPAVVEAPQQPAAAIKQVWIHLACCRLPSISRHESR